MDDNPGLYRIEVNEGPGSSIKIMNKPVPPAFKESSKATIATFGRRDGSVTRFRYDAGDNYDMLMETVKG